MFFYLAMVLAPAPPVALQQDRGLYVPSDAFDCFVRQVQRARAESRGPRDVFYVDLRRCPPNANVTRAPRRLGSFPSFRRPTPPVSLFPDFRRTTRDGVTVDRVLVVTGAELDCLADRERLRRVRSDGGPGRYRLEFERCGR
jgi:hypothetical protein